ncbi:MAG: ATP synthase F1 subunit delta [Bacteroidales bacterium]|jgi:F-type H+-transporting ATPase subunit delta|nr:ATP synthase F1 subunit delta [Bacteroidales bacterium]
MNNSIISTRYAKALMLVGIEHQCLDALEADMTLLAATVKDNPVFGQLLDSPVIQPVQKHSVMNELLEKKVHPMTLGFVHVLIRNRREIMLPGVARRFIELYEAHRGVKHVRLTSATELDEHTKDALQNKLNALYHADVRMTEEVNPDLIGGFILRVDDRQYDASLASGLKRMKKDLVK